MIQQAGLPTSDRMREVFDDVLSAPEFQYSEGSPLVRWAEAVLSWIQDFLRRWLPDLDEAQAQFLSWAFLILALLVFVLVAVRWAADHSPVVRRSTTEPAGGSDRPRDAAEWVDWARQSADAGRLRDAATGLYQSTILQLDSDGALRYRDWKTPGDYATEISRPELRGPFRDFLGSFVAVAFGPDDPTVEAYHSLTDRAARLGCPV